MDWSLIVAIIALVVSLLCPIFTTLINNHHEIKLKKISHDFEYRKSVITNYIRSTGRYLYGRSGSGLGEKGLHTGEIYLALPQNLWCYIDEIEMMIGNSEIANARNMFLKLCREIAILPDKA